MCVCVRVCARVSFESKWAFAESCCCCAETEKCNFTRTALISFHIFVCWSSAKSLGDMFFFVLFRSSHASRSMAVQHVQEHTHVHAINCWFWIQTEMDVLEEVRPKLCHRSKPKCFIDWRMETCFNASIESILVPICMVPFHWRNRLGLVSKSNASCVCERVRECKVRLKYENGNEACGESDEKWWIVLGMPGFELKDVRKMNAAALRAHFEWIRTKETKKEEEKIRNEFGEEKCVFYVQIEI